jgi:hypothetical protein
MSQVRPCSLSYLVQKGDPKAARDVPTAHGTAGPPWPETSDRV